MQIHKFTKKFKMKCNIVEKYADYLTYLHRFPFKAGFTENIPNNYLTYLYN